MAELRVARSELILGGPHSGKAQRAQALAAAWLAASAGHRAVYIATAQAWDEGMREHIERQRARRPLEAPRLSVVEEPTELAHAMGAHGRADTLIVVDCLTLWLTGLLMPSAGSDDASASELNRLPASADLRPEAIFSGALAVCAGPLVLISNELDAEAAPAGRDGRHFLDTLGGLNQHAAAACERVTLMSAGLPMVLKGAA